MILFSKGIKQKKEVKTKGCPFQKNYEVYIGDKRKKCDHRSHFEHLMHHDRKNVITYHISKTRASYHQKRKREREKKRETM